LEVVPILPTDFSADNSLSIVMCSHFHEKWSDRKKKFLKSVFYIPSILDVMIQSVSMEGEASSFKETFFVLVGHI
jgi:hypothetical protein